jgi:hypothetical protein
MRLSEREQRVLAELERVLAADDPRFARQFGPISKRSLWLRRVVRLLWMRRPDR